MKMNKKTTIGAVLILATVVLLILIVNGWSIDTALFFLVNNIIIIGSFVYLYSLLKKVKEAKGNMEPVAKIAAEILSTKMKNVRWFNFFSAKGTYNGRKAWIKCMNSGESAEGFWTMYVSIVPRRVQKPNKLFVITMPKPTPHTVTRGKLVQYRLDAAVQGVSVDSDKSFTREEIIAIFDELTKAAEIVEQGAQYFKE